MGGQVSSIRGKLSSENKKRGSKGEKQKIFILAFEVANVMSKSILLWQSLNDQEVIRLRTEVIKSEGVLKLVSDSEAVLLSLACREKLQDLMAIAGSVSRLGKKCQESAALQGFEHVFNDVLRQSIDISALEYSVREMESKVKKMERYIASTSNLYQELEILADLEQAVRRIHDDGGDGDNLVALEQKISWQRQEIKYLKDMSLWNRTFDKIVELLARTVCTVHGRIVGVFGPPAAFDLSHLRFGECNRFSQQLIVGSQQAEAPGGSFLRFCNGYTGGACDSYTSSGPTCNGHASLSASSETVESWSAVTECRADPASSKVTPVDDAGESTVVNGLKPGSDTGTDSGSGSSPLVNGLSSGSTGSPMLFNSPRSETDSTASAVVNGPRRTVLSRSRHELTGSPLVNGSRSIRRLGSVSGKLQVNGRLNRLFVDPKLVHQEAPSSTLGGSALALHYANVIIIIEKMVKFPQLVGNDARDDLYRMLPRSVRTGLKSRLRTWFRTESVVRLEAATASAWRENLESILSWLAPLAHNMIRWQSEHNFEQQSVSRTNVLLLQTLYFADQAKAEGAIVELLVGLNYLCWYEREMKATGMDCSVGAVCRDLDEYLDWQF